MSWDLDPSGLGSTDQNKNLKVPVASTTLRYVLAHMDKTGGPPSPEPQVCPLILQAMVATRAPATWESRCPHLKSLPEPANISSLAQSHGHSRVAQGKCYFVVAWRVPNTHSGFL